MPGLALRTVDWEKSSSSESMILPLFFSARAFFFNAVFSIKDSSPSRSSESESSYETYDTRAHTCRASEEAKRCAMTHSRSEPRKRRLRRMNSQRPSSSIRPGFRLHSYWES